MRLSCRASGRGGFAGVCRILSIAACCAAVAVSPARAQIFRGVVVDDSSKRPLDNVTVSLLDASGRDMARLLRTDSAGRYVLHIGTPGTYMVRAVRLGYQPLTSGATKFFGGEAVTLNFSMSAVTYKLGTVVVTDHRRLNRDELMSLVGFDLRKSRGQGLFLDTADLRQFKRHPIAFVLEDHGTVPRVIIGQPLGRPVIWMQKGMGTCKPQIFIDGFETGGDPTMPDRFGSGAARLIGLGADQIHAIEIYSRTTLPPPSIGGEIGDFGGVPPSQQCGAIAVWTKFYHAAVLEGEKKKTPR